MQFEACWPIRKVIARIKNIEDTNECFSQSILNAISPNCLQPKLALMTASITYLPFLHSEVALTSGKQI